MKLSNLLNPGKWSLSRKFLSIVLLILLIPLASIGLLKEIEKTLFSNLRENLLLSSRLIGNQLAQNKTWFDESLLPDSSQFLGKELFVFPLSRSFNLDGYFDDDWAEYDKYRQEYYQGKTGFSILLGSFERHLILSLKIDDQSIIYPSSDNPFLSDRIEIEYKDQFNEYHQIVLLPKTDGDFPVLSLKNKQLKMDWRFKAHWIRTVDGFNVEIKFPSGLKPRQLKVVQKNVNKARQKKYLQTVSSSRYDINPLVWPSTKLVNYIQNIELPDAQRIWVIDTRGRVLTSAGDLLNTERSFSSNPILNWILNNQSELPIDPRANNLHLDSEEIYSAQRGVASTRVENIKNTEHSIALAATPIQINNQVVGVLLLEENVARVQIVQKKTLINMFGIILAVFVLVMWIIFWYVSRMVGRIKHLNKAIDKVVDRQGRMSEPLDICAEDGDELDDLYRAFGQMGGRLYEYNDHLEKLASRLSHELRTPIAIVRSSLDNLLLNCQTEEDKEVIERALSGNQRLGEIISRMRQASGVKDAMQTAEKEWVDIEDFLRNIIVGYSQSFEGFSFQFRSSLNAKRQYLSPELFSEMLDKLIANAMEFSQENSPIIIQLEGQKGACCLRVINSGPLISKKNRRKIFQSLVSIRTSQQATGTNLGLGLYVVKLIAEFHQGKASAKNLLDDSGVEFSVCFQSNKP